MGLMIKDASEYKSIQAAEVQRANNEWQVAAIEFINSVVVPDIERRAIEGRGSTVLRVPKYPSDKFVAAVAALLTPKGFTVNESHDGGGMYATVVISWS